MRTQLRRRVSRSVLALAGVLVLPVLGLPAEARDGGPARRAGVSGSFGHVGFSGVRSGWHGVRSGWRGVGIYLDRRRDPAVEVTINQAFVPVPAPAAFVVPSLTDLPAVAGIRAPRPAEPAVYVLNEGRASQTTFRRTSGPKIIEAAPDAESGWRAQTDEPFGARIIHLTVPVGSGN